MSEGPEDTSGTDGRATAPSATLEQSPLAAVGALMDERRKYESWLGALAARRDATPARVFARVHADYTTRRDAVAAQLATHAVALRAELERGASRLAELSAEEESARDERDEAELRAHVGELEGEEWERVALAADERLGAIRERRATLEVAQARTRELLSEAERPSAALPVVADAAAPTQEGQVAHVTPVAVQAVPDGEPGAEAVSAAAPAAPTETAPLDIPLELPPAVIAAEAALNEPDPVRPSSAFDEIAFVSSVVDTPAGSVDAAPVDQLDEASRRDSFAMRAHDDEIVNLERIDDGALAGAEPGRTGTPLAGNVTGSSPIILSPTDSAKTLKCEACSAMNLPTDWYCDRCGAELASL